MHRNYWPGILVLMALILLSTFQLAGCPGEPGGSGLSLPILPPASVLDGKWRGTTSQGRPISFRVSGGGTMISGVQLGFSASASSYGCYSSITGTLFGTTSDTIDGDVTMIGAPDEGWAGAAYAFRWNGTAWVEAAKLTASDADSGDDFGTCVSISGDVALIGAPSNDDAGSSSGSACILELP